MATRECQAELGAKKLAGWAENNGLKLNPEKSTCVALSRKCGIHPDRQNTVHDVSIPVKKKPKFLNFTFGKKPNICFTLAAS